MINEALDQTEAKEHYDASCKLLLSQKVILASILKDYLPEFDGLTVEVIARDCIEGNPEVHRYATPKIWGISNEDTDSEEGRISGDIRFRAEDPQGIVKIFNIEAQNKFHQRYPMTKRGSYYIGRMISSQRGTEFNGSEYENLKKVYVIWIFLKPTMKWRNSVTYYETTQRQYIGSGSLKVEEYDLMTQILIGLGDPDSPQAVGALRMLDVIFSSKIKVEEKKRILEEEFHIPMTEELTKGVSNVGSFSDAVEEWGFERGVDSVNDLYDHLINDGRMDDLVRATRDRSFCQQLMDEYQIAMAH